MNKLRNLSIRKKLLINILLFSLILVGLATGITSFISYNTMKEQLIYNRRMSIGWLQDRLSLVVKDYMNQFYNFEVDKEIKNDITRWCTISEDMDYTVKWKLISAMNTAISMDSNINSIELFNLNHNQVLVAKRSGAEVMNTEDRLDLWNEREITLQTNLVFQREEREIIISHQIYDFYGTTPIALAVIKIRPYEIQDILEDIKATEDESILIFNDENELIETDYSETDSQIKNIDFKEIIKKLEESNQQEIFYRGNFWFSRSVNGGKLNILFAVPIYTIVNALNYTLLAGGLIAVIAVIISIIGSILFSKIFSSPIINLSTKMRTVMINDYSDETPQERNDEIGALQDSFNVMIERNQKLITREYQSKIEKREAQIRALQAQINPHFMHNTLQVIGGMALKKNAPEIYTMTTSLSDIMRYSLNYSKEMVVLREEIRYLQAYLTIQNERFGNRIELNIKIKKELQEYLIPKLILQPILENSLEHGLTNKVGSWYIELCAILTAEGDLLLEIRDNGVGISKDRLEEINRMLSNDAENALKTSSHIGLCNVDSRIRLRYPGAKYGVTIKSSNGEGTTVQIRTKAIKENPKYEVI